MKRTSARQAATAQRSARARVRTAATARIPRRARLRARAVRHEVFALRPVSGARLWLARACGR